MDNQVLNTIMKVAQANHIKLNPQNLDVTLKDIGVDSLAMMDLIFKVENELGVQLDDHVLVKIKNLGDLINAFNNALANK